jgi:subtilisin family serine protease
MITPSLKKRLAVLVLIIGAFSFRLPADTFPAPAEDNTQRDYLVARKTFYSLLKESSRGLTFEQDDYQKLQAAQLVYPGLYEHLMSYFHLLYVTDDAQEAGSRLGFQEISTRMAHEFLRSIPMQSLKTDISPLQSLVLSTGYYAQEALPTFRRFSRRVHRKVKGQWAFEDMRVREAHDISRGQGVRLAVIDTGLDPSLRDIRRHVNAYKDLLDSAGPNPDKGRFPYDWEGHGTSLASVILQVAPEVELMIIKFYEGESMGRVPESQWTHYLLAAGIMWAARNGADIINLSVSLRRNTPALRQAIRYCWDHNIVVITSMGNKRSPQHAALSRYPAAYPWTIAVGGVEKTEEALKIWENSASGPYVDVVAPAKDIWVEVPQYRGRSRLANNRNGNSLATSFVAGTAALMLAAMDADTRKILLSRPGGVTESIRRILHQTASNEKLGYLSPNPESGHGIIEIPKAIALSRLWTPGDLTFTLPAPGY